MQKALQKITKLVLLLSALALVAVGCDFKNATNQISNINTQSIQSQTEQSILYSGIEGRSALELLKEKYPVKTKNYDGIGEFVESINGKTPDANHFWAFYVNGQSSSIGAGQYITKAGDSIEWKLEEIK